MAVLKSHLLLKARSQHNEEDRKQVRECHPRLKEDPVIFKMEGQPISMKLSFSVFCNLRLFFITENWKIHVPEHYSHRYNNNGSIKTQLSSKTVEEWIDFKRELQLFQ